MYALLNKRTGKFYRITGIYGNSKEVETFIEACTFKTFKDANYKNNLLKEDYEVVDIEYARKINKLF